MCGIFGYISEKNINDEKVVSSLYNRGPENQNILKYTIRVHGKNLPLTFIHTRLSIIDYSSNSNQPMSEETENYVIVYNGEIYNYLNLKKELLSYGYHFKSSGDTEVLLKAYIHWGPEVLNKLRGMFAFCIFNKNEKKLFLARDHFGMKPLYYWEENGDFCFSSSVEAILKSEIKNKFEIDRSAIKYYLKFGSFISPKTIISEIKELLPGCYMIYCDGKTKINRYYTPENLSIDLNISEHEAKSELRNLLFDTIEQHLISDAPLGVFLSGGIDSSLIASIAARIYKKKLYTFTIGFKGIRGFESETSLATQTSNKIGSIHKNIFLNGNTFNEYFDEFILALDLPSIDGLNSFLISKAVKEYVKVVLTGLGGDEMFAGYPVFHEVHKLKHLSVFDKIIKYLPTGALYRLNKNHLQNIGLSLYEILLSKRIINPDMQIEEDLKKYFFENKYILKSVTLFEVLNYMSNTLLRDTDSVSMYHSIESRMPFVDKNIFEYVMKLPDYMKIQKGINKPLLVNTFSDILLPQTYMNKKKGFNLPLNKWVPLYITTELKDDLNKINKDFHLSNNSPFTNNMSIKKANFIIDYSWLVLLSWLKKNIKFIK